MTSTSTAGGAAGGQTGPAVGRKAKPALSPRTIIGLLITAIAVWFILANTETVRIHMFLVTVSSAMWVVLLFTFIGGGLAGLLYSGRRRKQQDQ